VPLTEEEEEGGGVHTRAPCTARVLRSVEVDRRLGSEVGARNLHVK
jgi:hypothetical protein